MGGGKYAIMKDKEKTVDKYHGLGVVILCLFHNVGVADYRWYIVLALHVLIDYVSLIVAEKTALIMQSIFRIQASQQMILPWDYQYIYIPGMFLLIMLISNGYKFNRPSMDMARDVFKGCCFGFLICMLMIFLMRNSMQVSRYYAVCFFVCLLLYMSIMRYTVGCVLHSIERIKEPVLLIGAGKTADKLLTYLEHDYCYYYRIIGIVDDHPVSAILPQKYPVLGGMEKAPDIIMQQGIRTVILAVPGLSEGRMRNLMYSIQHLTDTIVFVPGLVGSPLGSVEISTLFVEQLTLIKSKNNLSRWYNRWLKFAFDMLVTFCGTLLILPVLLLVAILVGIDNKGSIFFAHRRIGRNGREFPCYKFQTMVSNADEVLVKHLSENAAARREWEESFKLTNDPRVTRLGAWLRKTSLDELPQVFNVLKGEMSLVGPRPVVQAEIEKYGEHIREYYMVRPGITGMWQTSGRSDTTYAERVAMDTWYVRNWSLWIDMKYLLKTFSAVLEKKGAY